MKKVFLGVFIAVIILCSVLSVYYITAPLNSVDVSCETVEHLVNDPESVIIRDEKVYYSEIDGTLYNNVGEGERVAKDSLICTVFSGTVSDDKLKELRTIDKKIAHRRERLRESTLYRSGGIDTESKVAGIVRDISKISRDNDVIKIADYKEDLNNLRSGVEISDEDILQSLILEKEAVENRISTSRKDVTADMSGVFVAYTDGLEGALMPESIDNYTIDYMNHLTFSEPAKISSKNVETDSAVCKIVNNHIWYTAMRVPSETAQKHKTGEEVTLRFKNIAGELIHGTIYRISDTDENGYRLVIVKCPMYFEGALSYRRTDIDMIFESYTGYKIPIQAIRSDDNGNKYVKAMKGTREYNCYCDILYTDSEQEFIIVDSVSGAENKIKDMERIIIGER